MTHVSQENSAPAVCPYCRLEFKVQPERSGHCPQCRNKIYVHTQQMIYDHVLLSKAQAQVVARFIRVAKSKGYTEDYYHETFYRLEQEQGIEPTPDQVMDVLEQEDVELMDPRDVTTVGDYYSDTPEPVNTAGEDDEDHDELMAIYEAMVVEQEDDMLTAPSLPVLVSDDSVVVKKKEPAKKRKYRDRQTFILESVSILEALGISLSEVDQHHEMLTDELDREPHAPEVIFSIFQKSCRYRYKNHHRASRAYLKLARLYHSYGFRCFSIQRQAMRERLLCLRDQGCKYVELELSSHSPGVKQWNGKVMPTNEAIVKLPLPHRDFMDATQPDDQIGWCDCDYVPVGAT